jgi:hypothetical protein
MTWVCDIPGASPLVSTLHLALHLGLAAFVVGAGIVFVTLAAIAYRRPPLDPSAVDAGSNGPASTPPGRLPAD